jgi:hypothetical protein
MLIGLPSSPSLDTPHHRDRTPVPRGAVGVSVTWALEVLEARCVKMPLHRLRTVEVDGPVPLCACEATVSAVRPVKFPAGIIR